MDVYNLPLPGMEELAPGVWRYSGDERGVSFAGSIHSTKFHRLVCWHAHQILPVNRVCFRDRRAAVDYGYQGCSKCKPLAEEAGAAVAASDPPTGLSHE